MEPVALYLKVKVQPGKRDQVRALWEKHPKPRVEASEVQNVYFYSYDDNDENTIYMFEHYSDRSAFEANAQAPWFAEYMGEVAPLLAGQPEVGVSTPVWSKVKV